MTWLTYLAIVWAVGATVWARAASTAARYNARCFQKALTSADHWKAVSVEYEARER